MSIFAPERSCNSWMRAPPAPMTRPTEPLGISKYSPEVPSCPPPATGSISWAMIALALSTCCWVPTSRTRQLLVDLSTSTCAPLRERISAICEPLVPMILPVACLGRSTTPSTEGPAPGEDAAEEATEVPAPAAAAETAAAAASACARARATASSTKAERIGVPKAARAMSAASCNMALAASTASLVPLISTWTGSSVWSLASTRAPLRSRISLIVAPPLPMMRPMMSRGSGSTSRHSGCLMSIADTPAAAQPDRVSGALAAARAAAGDAASDAAGATADAGANRRRSPGLLATASAAAWAAAAARAKSSPLNVETSKSSKSSNLDFRFFGLDADLLFFALALSCDWLLPAAMRRSLAEALPLRSATAASAPDTAALAAAARKSSPSSRSDPSSCSGLGLLFLPFFFSFFLSFPLSLPLPFFFFFFLPAELLLAGASLEAALLALHFFFRFLSAFSFSFLSLPSFLSFFALACMPRG
mmetsp:Transcript_53911/g.154819  ORF Transcript_53911/g.154819 Transcript_53911/m.154819 type:complete len:477 (+) Transcript_53911:947-2377(+)